MGKEKYVHGPASVGQCTICHVLTAEHAFKPIENVGKLCNQDNAPDVMTRINPLMSLCCSAKARIYVLYATTKKL
jgi:hypothetical protein